jgi:hypothetical protein
MAGSKVPCELKRDYHADIRTAIQNQLERFYTRDPDARGFGLYCVFWFGQNRNRKMPDPPNGLLPPESAAQMRKMLYELMPDAMRSRIAIFVIDVSGKY